MLMGFKVQNYRSFKDLQRFSMLAGMVRSNENHILNKENKVLGFTGVYGANGSGKSNLILAIHLVKGIVENGANAIINSQYYRGNESGKEKKSYFEYELLLDNKKYSYGFEMNIFRKEIISEWLIDMTKAKEKIIFERDIKKGIYTSDIIERKYTNFSSCLEEMKFNNKITFLNEMSRRLLMAKNTDPYYKDVLNVFNFITNDIIVIRPSTHNLFGADYFKRKNEILNILKFLDINIIDIVDEKDNLNNIQSRLSEKDYLDLMAKMDAFSNTFNNFNCTLRVENDIYTIKKDNDGSYSVSAIKFIHSNNDSKFGAYEESDGTIRCIELLDVLLSNNKLFLIDELDSSLHPLLVEGLLKRYLNTNKSNQLIITTHELKTMDFDLVRRDEIWFSEKNEEGASRLYSLEEYKDVARFDKKIDKAYLEGRFGAIANIGNDYAN